MTLIVMALRLGWSVGSLDIMTAFLQTDPAFSKVGSKRTFLRPPPGLQLNKLDVLEVLSSIYGLKTAQRQWQRTFVAAIEKYGFRVSAYSDCILTGTINGKPVILITYVDDIVVLGSTKAARAEAFATVHQEGTQILNRSEKGEVAFLE